MDNMQPIVSVVVPVYNVEKYLCRCIDSILNQTFTDFELILADDGSTDSCGAICDAYAAKDSRVKVIHRKNGGVSAARNTGLDAAEGEYIAFVDSDDYIDRDFLQVLVSAMEEVNADVVVSNYRKENDRGERSGVRPHEVGKTLLQSADERMRYLVQNIMGGKAGWEVYTRLFRRSVIEANGIRFCTTCGNYAEDLGFVLQYCLTAKACSSVAYCGYTYFLRKNSMMRRSEGQIKLDQVNAVSRFVSESFYREMPRKRKQFALIHFLILQTEYQKLIGTPDYCKLPEKIRGIEDYPWWRAHTKGIWCCARELEALCGRKAARQILLLSHFCLHGNWKRFKIESAIAYRWFIK